MPGRIFISYRRGDEPGFAHALYARLEQVFSNKQLFMDVEGGIPAGADFVVVLEAEVAQCDVLLALIGQGWLTATDKTGARRLEKPDDFVRIEIESAMRMGKHVIPVLINRTEMPSATDLPRPLQPLARRNAVRLTQERFKGDVEGLIEALKGALHQTEGTSHAARTAKDRGAPTRRWLLYGLSGATVAAIAGGAIWILQPRPPSRPSLIRTFTGHRAAVWSVAFSPDGRTALSGSEDKTLKLWEIAAGNELRTFTGHSGPVLSVTFSPDGRTALSSSADETVRLWEVATGKELRSFTGHSNKISSVAFSPDGHTALSGSHDGTLKLWDVATGAELRTFGGRLSRALGGLLSRVFSVAFSPDGHTALFGSRDLTLTLWEMATGNELRTLTGHSNMINSVAFSSDGRSALSASEDKTLKLWEVATGMELRTFTGHLDAVHSVAFSPDGRTALSSSRDRTLKLWDLTVL